MVFSLFSICCAGASVSAGEMGPIFLFRTENRSRSLTLGLLMRADSKSTTGHIWDVLWLHTGSETRSECLGRKLKWCECGQVGRKS